MKKRIAIIGTRGVPAQYGGFESLAENLIDNNNNDELEYTVFCSSIDTLEHRDTYKGARLRYLPLHANGFQSIPYDITSMLESLHGYDILLILGTSGCTFLPTLRRLVPDKRIIVNIGGVEHHRGKWGSLAKSVLRRSEAMAVKYADVVIADNRGIVDYVRNTYGREAHMIAYGGDHVLCNTSEAEQQFILADYGLKAGEYGVSVCRIEPENNCHITLQAFAESGIPLVFIGNWEYSSYSRDLYHKYHDTPGIHLLDATYDLGVLYTLRRNAAVYVHGHSAGGTNPSLVEAMFFGRPILAYDVVYNRETLHGLGSYYSDVATLRRALRRLPDNGSALRSLAEREYTWRHITAQYEELYTTR
jgi:glycosyltransferase involved in cell wall biosynthesis